MNYLDKTKRELVDELIALRRQYNDLQKRRETEISSIKQQEEIFSLNEGLVFDIFENSMVGISLTTADGRMRTNKAFSNILGYSEDELLGKKWQEITHPDDLEICQEALDSIFSGNQDFVRWEKRYIHKNGKVVWVDISSIIRRDVAGRSLYYITSINDITEKKIAEIELKESEERLRIIMEVTQTAIWDWNVKNDVWYTSPLYYTMLGYKPVSGASDRELWLERVHPEDRDMVAAKIMKVLKSGAQEYNYEARMKHANGTYRWHMVRGFVASRDKEQKVTRLLGTRVDITSQKMVEKELMLAKEKAEASDRLKTAFLQNISHEIRTPMNGILGFADLLKDSDLSENERGKYISIIEESGKSMLNIISDLIDISKIETGHVEIIEESFDLNVLLDDLYLFFQLEAQKRGLKLTYKTGLPQNESAIVADKTKLKQVLTNLIGNALKFTSKGFVSFSYSLDNNQLLFCVKDSGVGISSGFQEKIFDRFIQENLMSKVSLEGSGLGLAISKGYIEKMGGKIWVKSEQGKGAEFYFLLPYKKVYTVLKKQQA